MPRYSPGGGSTTVTATATKRNLWNSPPTPHIYDVEFEGPITFNSGSDGGWWYENNGTSGSYATTEIDKYTSYTSGDMRIHINETHTPSWMRLQIPSDSNYHTLKRKITVPTNMLIYCRFRYTQHIGNTTSDNPRWTWRPFHADTPSTTDSNYLSVQVDNGETFIMAHRHDNGVHAQVGITTDVDSQGQAIQYLALHKVGDTYHYWAGTKSNWVYMGNYTNAYTPSLMILAFHTHNQNHIFGLDFIRFLETDKFPF